MKIGKIRNEDKIRKCEKNRKRNEIKKEIALKQTYQIHLVKDFWGYVAGSNEVRTVIATKESDIVTALIQFSNTINHPHLNKWKTGYY